MKSAEILEISFGFSPEIEYYLFGPIGFSNSPIEFFLVSNLAVILRLGDTDILLKSSSLSFVFMSYFAIGFCGLSLKFIGDSTDCVDKI